MVFLVVTGALREPPSVMSSEESYRAILRYLTNEREPYAPGTEGNVKRKIRKAAACYVVRGGTLYYQRRQRHRKTFAELEVVLQPERRRGLIEAAHLGPGGTHHTRHQTWHDLSKTYWWRGETRRAGRWRARPMCVLASSGVFRTAVAGPACARGRAARGRVREPHWHRKEAGRLGADLAGWARGLLGAGRGGAGLRARLLPSSPAGMPAAAAPAFSSLRQRACSGTACPRVPGSPVLHCGVHRIDVFRVDVVRSE